MGAERWQRRPRALPPWQPSAPVGSPAVNQAAPRAVPRIQLSVTPFALPLAFLAAPIAALAGESELRCIDGTVHRGELRKLGPESVALELPGGELLTRPLSDCVSLQLVRPDPKASEGGSEGASPPPFEARVELDAGEWLQAPVTGGSGDQLALQLAGAPLVVNVDAIRRLTFPARVPRGFLEPPPPPNADRLYKRNVTKDKESVVEPVHGTLIAFRENGIEFEGVFGRDVFPFDRIVSLSVASIGSTSRSVATAEPNLVLALVPDGRLTLRLEGLVDGFLRGESPRLGRVSISLRALRSIRFRGERFRVLSELEPVEVVETPYFGGDASPKFSWRRDRSVMGGPLRVAGVTFENGLGVHARSSLTFEPGPGFQAFRAKVGIDDSTLDLPRRGSVVFRVLGDGNVLWESPIVRSGDRPLETPEIDLRSVKRLGLVADFADGFDIADRANWCEPILLKDPPRLAPGTLPESAPRPPR